MSLSRRRWLAAAFGVSTLGAALQRDGSPPRRILVLGGTRFVGRHIVAAALARGHIVTLFNRGRTAPDLFPEAETVIGDREGDHAALGGRRWDIVVDTSGTEPAWVERACGVLVGAVDRYVYISSIAAYAPGTTPRDEDSPLHPVQTDGPKHYGHQKVVSEQIVTRAFGGQAMILRPGALVGPHDTRFRFVRWPLSAREGGELLAPGRPEALSPLADARDLAAWLVTALERETTGTFNIAAPHFTTGDLIAAALQAGAATPVWVDAAWLAAQRADFDSLPSLRLTAGRAIIADRAIAEGLRFRPLADSMSDTLAWWDRQPTAPKTVTTMTRARELELLAAWHAG